MDNVLPGTQLSDFRPILTRHHQNGERSLAAHLFKDIAYRVTRACSRLECFDRVTVLVRKCVLQFPPSGIPSVTHEDKRSNWWRRWGWRPANRGRDCVF